MQANSRSRVLILAYGNPLRSDDGIGWRASELLNKELPPTAETICIHQLTPELAQQVSNYQTVIFLDAAREGEPGAIHCEPISVQSGNVHFWHHLTPENLLALSQQLYGATPQAFSVSLSGESFGHGETLSPVVAKNLPHFVAKVMELVDQLANSSAVRLK
jgi:hydrogenase maturation protease